MYLRRCFSRGCCFPCVKLGACKSCYEYSDKKFKPNEESLGFTPSEKCTWRRANELCKDVDHCVLFEGIEPQDIVQGTLGDCWLMSALACLAEYPGLITNAFGTAEYSTRGKYTVRLYNGYIMRWEDVTVDDWIPCSLTTGRPLFAQPNGNEIWVLLLEKVFAKWSGCYKALDGGSILWAFRALTGDFVFSLEREVNGAWGRWDLMDKPPSDQSAFRQSSSGEKYSRDELFNLCRTYLKRKALLGASIASGAETKRSDGLVQGHAYSLLSLRRVGKGMLGALSSGKEFKLVQLRNPWGSFVWTGNWSDSSSLWKQYPKVHAALRPDKVSSKGTFWMDFEDFCRLFDKIDLCDRTVGVTDLYLDIKEDDGCCKKAFGPCMGCTSGCVVYWCCCKGCRVLYGGHDSQPSTRKPEIVAADDSVASKLERGVKGLEASIQ